MYILNETMEDYYARLNFEANRTFLIGNRGKINYIYNKSRKYFKNASTACEVGIGDGYLLRLLYNSGLKVVGIDISNYVVNRLRDQFYEEQFDIKLIQEDFSRINLQTDKFDLFFCLDVLEHIVNLRKAIENIKNNLSIGGLLIVTLPLNENLNNKMVMCPKCHNKFHRIGHYHSFDSIEEINQLLGPEFKIIQMGDVNPISKPSEVIYHIGRNIWKNIFKNKTTRTIYFIAKFNKRR